MSLSTILVAGGTGRLGEPVARRLQADGYRVRILSHRPERARALFGPEFDIVEGNVEDPNTLPRALAGCHGLHINLFSATDPDLERRGVQHLAQASSRAGLQFVTYLSGATVCEENAWFPGTRAKLGAEAALRTCGVPFTIFRAASFMEGLPQYVRGNSASLVGAQPQPWHWVAVSDFARMVSRAFATRASAGKTLYIHGPQSLTTRDALTEYCRLVHPGMPLRTMPLWLAQTVATCFRVRDLADALPYLRYFEKVSEAGDPTEANTLLGTPTTTLAEWSSTRAKP